MPKSTASIDLRPIEEQRADRGYSTPSWEEKCAIWSRLSIPQAGISAERGGYIPNRLIAAAHKHPARSILIAGGVRGGKSLSASTEVVAWAPHSDLIWIAAASYDLTRQEFEYTAEALLSLGWTNPDLISMPKARYQPCALETVWGGRIETRTLADVNTFVARAPDLIVVCEPGQAPPETVAKARERLSTRRGRLWLAGTFEDIKETWYEDYWRRWVRWPNPESGKSFSVPSWTNQYSYPGGKHDPEMVLLRNSFPSFNSFLLRCAGVPVPAASQVIGDFWSPRVHVDPGIEFIPVSPNGVVIPVELAVDPGYGGGSHYAVEALQVIGDNKYVIDEVAIESLVHTEVISMCQARPWWRNVTSGVIDPYAADSHALGSVSPREVWWSAAKVNLRTPPRWRVEDTVAAFCNELRDPTSGQARIFFSPRAQRAIWEMTHWRRRKVSGGYAEPSKRNCDAIKALAYHASEQYHRIQTAGLWGRPAVKDVRYA